jgi:hypothetical protein
MGAPEASSAAKAGSPATLAAAARSSMDMSESLILLPPRRTKSAGLRRERAAFLSPGPPG